MSRLHYHLATNLDELYCRVCNGSGKTYLEHPDGSLSEEVCPLCKGRKNSTYIKENFDTRQGGYEWWKALIGFYVAFLGFTMLQPMHHFWTASEGIKVIHFVLWVLLVPMLIWGYCHPKPRRPGKKVRQPNPLTTDRERLMGGVVLGGALLKSQYDHRHRHNHRGEGSIF